MIATGLFYVSIAILSVLSIYALAHLFLAVALFFVRKNDQAHENVLPIGGVAVLMPSQNEHNGLLDAVNAVLRQNYSGKISVCILLENASDDSLPEMEKRFKWVKKSDVWRAQFSENREIELFFTGYPGKKNKISWWLDNFSADYIAFLDADHRPTADWISQSIFKIEQESYVAIQAQRKPLSITSLAALWDSAQNHIGNEVLNIVLSFFGFPVFFTGTAAVFRGHVFKKSKFSDCLAEDTWLSHDVILSGLKIGYTQEVCSYEYVAPEIKSYVSRRRRWSAGHTKSFFAHFGQILKAKISLPQKLFLLAHGSYYLLGLLVCLLFWTYGLFAFWQFPINGQIFCALLSFVLAIILGLAFARDWRDAVNACVAGFLQIFPQMALLMVYFYKFSNAEIYYYILVFPFSQQTFWWQLFLLLAPILVIISGLYYFGKIFDWRNFWLIPTFPVFLFLDIYASLLGFFDFISGKSYWSKIRRANKVSLDLVPENLRKYFVSSEAIKPNNLGAKIILFLIIAVIISNDLLAQNNCGDIKPFLWKPIFFNKSAKVDWKFLAIKSGGGNNSLDVSFVSEISGPGELEIRYFLDDRLVGQKILTQGREEARINLPLGWQQHKFVAELTGKNIHCQREQKFSNVLQEIKGKDLYINGEVFLIKGIIPSFAGSQVNVSLEQGLRQIKEAGANAIRLYHEPSQEMLDLAAKYNLLVLAQPDRSTWGEMNVENIFSRQRYQRYWEKMLKKTQGYPYLLFNNFGNEWELGKNPEKILPQINSLISNLNQKQKPDLSSYSTYLTYQNFSSDVVGVNMLDTGQTYWQGAMTMLASSSQPFYASEFGGFVAYWEKIPWQLRASRIKADWQDLLAHKAMGAMFFESHDNWAQAVPKGYNDPFRPEQPDDERGLWDTKNNPKPELKSLMEIYSDFQWNCQKNKLEFKNIRPYALNALQLRMCGQIFELGSLPSGQKQSFVLPKTCGLNFAVQAIYYTHQGLGNVSVGEISCEKENKSRGEFLDVIDLKYSSDGFYWQDFDSGKIGQGIYYLQFKLPREISKQKLLLLEGIGDKEILIRPQNGKFQKFVAHEYRQLAINLAKYYQDWQDQNIIIKINRQYNLYYDSHGQNKDVFILLEKPKIFVFD